MPYFSRAQRRRYTLPLLLVLLLHWSLGLCEAMASVLCFEGDGHVVLEAAGQPCATSAAADTPCLDIKLDAHADHASLPASPLLQADSLAPALLPALLYFFPLFSPPASAAWVSTGPPPAQKTAALRRSIVLQI